MMYLFVNSISRWIGTSILLLLLCQFYSCEQKQESVSASFLPINKPQVFQNDTLKIAFYNVENLFDLEYDGSEYPEYMPGNAGWSEQMLKRRLENISSVIGAINADIIALCEIEDEDALTLLQKQLAQSGVKYNFKAITQFLGKSSTSPCILSKVPIEKSRSLLVNVPQGKTRDILEADLSLKNSKMKLFVNHWPSKKNDDKWRIEAAKVLQKRISELPGNTEFIVLGDFNTNFNEAKQNKSDINSILGTTRSISENGITYWTENSIGESYGTIKMVDLWQDVHGNNRFSLIYKGRYQTLDRILLPKTLFDSTGWSYLDNSFCSFTMNGKLLKNNVPFRWQMKYLGKNRKVHLGEGYSDHLPVYAYFINKPFKQLKDAVVLSNNDNDTTQKINQVVSWVPCNNLVSIQGNSSFTNIKSVAQSKNVCGAILEYSGKRHLFACKIKGFGKISFRVKNPDGEYIYFNGPDFKTKSRSARYVDFKSDMHYEIKIPLSNQFNGEIELRIGKESKMDVYISNEKFI